MSAREEPGWRHRVRIDLGHVRGHCTYGRILDAATGEDLADLPDRPYGFEAVAYADARAYVAARGWITEEQPAELAAAEVDAILRRAAAEVAS